MKVLNVHRRRYPASIAKLGEVMETLSGPNDRIWPLEHWPAMKLAKGLEPGSAGGHGPVRYSVGKYVPGRLVEFIFSRPIGFDGVHRLEAVELSRNETELIHTIDADVKGSAIFAWAFAIRWLHDALLEDALDKVENHLTGKKKRTPWSVWVRLLRAAAKRKRKSSR